MLRPGRAGLLGEPRRQARLRARLLWPRHPSSPCRDTRSRDQQRVHGIHRGGRGHQGAPIVGVAERECEQLQGQRCGCPIRGSLTARPAKTDTPRLSSDLAEQLDGRGIFATHLPTPSPSPPSQLPTDSTTAPSLAGRLTVSTMRASPFTGLVLSLQEARTSIHGQQRTNALTSPNRNCLLGALWFSTSG